MKKATVYLREDQMRFLNSVYKTGVSRSRKFRILLDQLIWAYRKGILSESELKTWDQEVLSET